MFFFTGCQKINPERQLMVRTGPASEITHKSCNVSGEIIDMNEDVTRHGFCYGLGENPAVQVIGSVINSNEGTIDLGPMSRAGTFAAFLPELRPETRYFIRAFATDNQVTIYGENISIITGEDPTSPPTVETHEIVNISDIYALGGGNIISDGGAPVTEKGICWSIQKGPTMADYFIISGDGPDSFKSDMEGLFCDETYFVRAFAINLADTAYGNEVSFTTEGCTVPAILLIRDDDGVWLVDDRKIKTLFTPDKNLDIDAFENRFFINNYRDISVWEANGSPIRTFNIGPGVVPGAMCVLPGDKLAFIDNNGDSVYFTNAEGFLEAAVSLTGSSPDERLQNVNGLWVENSLIVSEDGNQQVMRFDLGSRKRSVLMNLGHLDGWLSDIDFENGRFYICQSQRIYSFRPGEVEQLICEIPDYHNLAIAVHGKFAYVASSKGNKIYRVNLADGTFDIYLDGLNNPRDIEILE